MMKTIDFGRPLSGKKPASPIFARASGLHFDARETADALEVEIYDEIGFWGVTAEQVRNQLRASSAARINVRMHSPGGDVFDGIAIYNELVAHPARVSVEVVGLAASIASLIAMAGDEIRIADNGFMMVHNAWVFALGNKADLRETADLLDQIDGALIKTYAARTGTGPHAIGSMMDSETWLDGAAAVEAGFADAVFEMKTPEARFDVSAFAHAPAALAQDIPERSFATVRDVERALMQDAGLTRSKAREMIRACKEVRDVTRDADPELSELAAILDATLLQLRA